MIVVEDGSGLPNSNSYASIDEATTYCLDRGFNEWATATPDQRSAALIRATDYIDATYLFKSVPLSDTQALACPRFTETMISPKLKAATITLAVMALSIKLIAPAERGIAIKKITAGKVATETTYDPVAPASADPYPFLTKMLKGVAIRADSRVQIGQMTR